MFTARDMGLPLYGPAPGVWAPPALRVVSAARMSDDSDDRSKADRAMARFADGDDSAFDIVYRVFWPRLHAFGRHLMHSRVAADDVAQETFARMIEARNVFRRGARVLPWAVCIARRIAYDYHRHEVHHALLDAFHPDAYAAALIDGETPEDATERHRLLHRVTHVLLRLPEKQRLALELVVGEGLSHAEAAEAIGTNANNVKQLVHRAREALRAALARGEKRK